MTPDPDLNVLADEARRAGGLSALPTLWSKLGGGWINHRGVVLVDSEMQELRRMLTPPSMPVSADAEMRRRAKNRALRAMDDAHRRAGGF